MMTDYVVYMRGFRGIVSPSNNEENPIYQQGFKEGASAAIHKFVNDVWEELEIDEVFDIERPRGPSPTQRKATTIEVLRDLLVG